MGFLMDFVILMKPLPHNLCKPFVLYLGDSYVRDLEYDWQTLVENVVDPSHVPFAHHGLQGNRAQASLIPIEITESTTARIEAKTEGRFRTRMTFEPPCRVEYAIAFGDTGK
jgi:phenylpropionate dioxygenase-like ring-hydroxylating dioxygenase large terminal subunit